MRNPMWRAATVLALCLVAALMGLARTHAEAPGAPNSWVHP